MNDLRSRIDSYVEDHKQCLTALLQSLVRIPSENTPPAGAERACQEFCAQYLTSNGWAPELYALDTVPGLPAHPLFLPGRDYTNRPNLTATRKGTGGGRSLILSGHIDTVPRGTLPWTVDPFGGEVQGNRLLGRGSNDMKGGIAANLFVARALQDLKIALQGDLTIETVVDEEFGGANGTLAGRLRGPTADAAVISEPSFLRVCHAQRGGCVAHITLRAPGGILSSKAMPSGVVDSLRVLLDAVARFAKQRRANALKCPAYASLADPVPVSIMKISTGPWGMSEPITIPETCQVEMYWQFLPGERREGVMAEFQTWLRETVESAPGFFPVPPEVAFPVRTIPGSMVGEDSAVVTEMVQCAAAMNGTAPAVQGIEGPCDLFLFQDVFHIPAILWGARGGNTHGADEYVELDTVVAAAKTLLWFVCRWCGVAGA